MEDQFESPKWVPYTPPPPKGWARIRFWANRIAFPIFVVLFVAGLVLVFTTDVLSIAEGDDERPAPGQTARYERPAGIAEEGNEMPGMLSVSTDPAGAWVTLNGREVGSSPAYGLSVSPGRYMVTLEKSGFYRVDTVIVARSGERSSIDVTLAPRTITGAVIDPGPPASEEPFRAERSFPPQTGGGAEATQQGPRPSASSPARPAGPAYVLVESVPEGAEVWAGDRLVGITPALVRGDALPGGEVTIRQDGFEPWTRVVETAPGETKEVTARLREQRATLRVLVRPWGSIYVNDSLRARDHDIWFEAAVRPGDHAVEAVHPVLGRRTQTVSLAPGEKRDVVIDLQSGGG